MTRYQWETVAAVAAVLVACILVGFFLHQVAWVLVLAGICLVVVMAVSGALT